MKKKVEGNAPSSRFYGGPLPDGGPGTPGGGPGSAGGPGTSGFPGTLIGGPGLVFVSSVTLLLPGSGSGVSLVTDAVLVKVPMVSRSTVTVMV